MTAPEPPSPAAVDDTSWAAIGDPTRRRVLDLLLTGASATPTALAERLPVTRQAVAKHLAVLHRAGLVHPETSGRERHYRVDRAALDEVAAQLRGVADLWDGRLQRIKALAESIEENLERG